MNEVSTINVTKFAIFLAIMSVYQTSRHYLESQKAELGIQSKAVLQLYWYVLQDVSQRVFQSCLDKADKNRIANINTKLAENKQDDLSTTCEGRLKYRVKHM